MTQHTIGPFSIESDEDYLSVIASPPPLWKSLGLAAVMLAFVLGLGGPMFPMVLKSIRRFDRQGVTGELVFFGVWMLLIVGIIVIATITIRRQRQLLGFVLKEGVVRVHTPAYPTALHEFPRGDLLGAVLDRGSVGSVRSTLIIRRRSGRAIVLFERFLVEQLEHVAQRINETVVDEQYAAFEVLLVNRPADADPPRAT